MQGQNTMANSFTESVDLNQGSVSSNTGMNQSAAWNSMLNPLESQMSSYTLPSVDGNLSTVTRSARSFSGWELGESSSGANLLDCGVGYVLKMEHGQPSFGAQSRTETRVEERQFESRNSFLRESVSSGIGGNQFTGRPLIVQSSSPSRVPRNINLNFGHMGNNREVGLGVGPDACHNLFKLGGPETGCSSTINAPSDNVVTSGSPGCFVESNGGSGSSLGSWGSSCKRKALEGASGQYPGGSSSCFLQSENNAPNSIPAHHRASGGLSISSPPVNSPPFSLQQLQARIDIAMDGVASESFSPSVVGNAENTSRNFDSRVNLEHHESGRFDLSSAGNLARHSNVRDTHQSSGPFVFADSLDSRLAASLASSSGNPPIQSSPAHVTDLARNMPPFPWNGAFGSQGGGSFMISGERGVSLHDEANIRGTPRNSREHPMFVPATETRNIAQDPNSWNFFTGITSSSSATPSGSRFGLNPSIYPFPDTWASRGNSPSQHEQRLFDFAPWILFPSVDSDSGGQRGQFSQLRSGPSASEETVMSSGPNSQGPRTSYSRTALSMEVPGDDLNGWRASAADFEGRQRLVSEIRQALNAMRGGENLRAEDYMLFDPFMNGAGELHDSHRDMRLDVDNMSYEELLALEEHIGNVGTGLSEETIMESMKRRKYLSITLGSSLNSEPCCICQEEYVTGEDIGTLDCGHDFHTNCIKQWLTIKNLCPICKMTALGT